MNTTSRNAGSATAWVPTRSVTETLHLTYDASTGLLTKTVAHKGLTTHLCYYDVKVSTAAPDRSDQVPALKTLLKGLKLEKEEAAIPTFACPHIPDTSNPPLLAQCSYMVFPNGSKSDMDITLFDYSNASGDSGGVLVADSVLHLEGVTVDVSSTPWKIIKAVDRQGLEVSLQQVANIKTDTETTTETTSTHWYKNNDARQTQNLAQSTTFDSPVGALRVKSESPLKMGKLNLTAILDQHVRSARSDRVMAETEQDDRGRPISMTYHTYDARHRLLNSATYAWNAEAFASQSAKGNALKETKHKWTETGSGTWVVTVGPDGRKGRILFDGLQRPVRRELQRQAGSDDSSQNYVCLEEVSYGADGEPRHRCVYDYHPGGLCVRNDGMTLPATFRDWFWHAEAQHEKTDSDGTYVQQTGDVIGTLLQGPVYSIEQTQKHQTDGQVTHLLSHKRWNKASKAMETIDLSSERHINKRGLCDEFTEQIGTASRQWKHQYDELGRRTQTIAPNGAVVSWTFEGLSNIPSTISLKDPSGKEQQLGKQTLRGAGNHGDVIESRTVGSDGSSQTTLFTNNGYQRADGTEIWSESSDDGTSVCWYTKGTQRNAAKALVTQFTYNKVTQALNLKRPESKANLQSLISTERLSPRLLGQILTSRTLWGMLQREHVQHSLRGEVSRTMCSNGVASRAWHDRQNRRVRVRRAGLDYRYRYAAQGELEQVSVSDRRKGRSLLVCFAYDGFGREVQRVYRLDGKIKSRYEQSWSVTGQLLSKSWLRNDESEATRTETFTYETLSNELKHWSVEAKPGYEIQDKDKLNIKDQAYTYDALGNVLTCITGYLDGASETRTYVYDNPQQPTQRTGVKVSHASKTGAAGTSTTLTLASDSNGSLTTDVSGHLLGYNPDGRLQSVKRAGDSKLLASYEYDHLGRLASQWDESTQQRRVMQYKGDQLCGEMWLDAGDKPLRHRVLDEEAGLVVQCRDIGQPAHTWFLLPDPQNGGCEEYSIDASGAWQSQSIGFTPWGEAPLDSLNTLKSGIGYNRQSVDPVTGAYHLGNGYRVYDPGFQAFLQSDSLSPFGQGGLNDRAYCAGRDPVNWHDPSGRVMVSRREQSAQLTSLDDQIRESAPPHHEPTAWWEWLLYAYGVALTIGLSVITGGAAGALILAAGLISCGLGAAELALRHSNPRLSKNLGWASLAVGFADSAATGFLKAGRFLLKAGRAVGNGLRRLKNASTMKYALRRTITNPLERAHPTLAKGEHSLQSIHDEMFTLHSIPDSKGLFINGHGLPVDGIKRGGPNGPPVAEFFSTNLAPEIDFYTRDGLKAMMLGKSYDSVLMGISKPVDRLHTDVVPNYIISKLSHGDLVTEFPALADFTDEVIHKGIALKANNYGFDYLELKSPATLDSVLNVLEMNGHRYQTINGMFCRGTASLLPPAGTSKIVWDMRLAAIYTAKDAYNYTKGVRKFP